MEPVSITFLAIGATIAAVEGFRYVKKKFFHKVENRHAEEVMITADELSGDIQQLTSMLSSNHIEFIQISELGDGQQRDLEPTLETNHNRSDDRSPSHQDERRVSDMGATPHPRHIHGTNIKITVKSNSASIDHTQTTHRERGDSEVGKKIADVIPSMISPTAAISTAVGAVIKDNIGKIKLKNPFAKRDDKKQPDKDVASNHDDAEVTIEQDSYQEEMAEEPPTLLVKDIPDAACNSSGGQYTMGRAVPRRANLDTSVEHDNLSASSDSIFVSAHRSHKHGMYSLDSSPICASPSRVHKDSSQVANAAIYDSGVMSCTTSPASSPVYARKSSISDPSLPHSKLYHDYGASNVDYSVIGYNTGAKSQHRDKRYYKDEDDIIASKSNAPMSDDLEVSGGNAHLEETSV